jgi:hypothetical protein
VMGQARPWGCGARRPARLVTSDAGCALALSLCGLMRLSRLPARSHIQRNAIGRIAWNFGLYQGGRTRGQKASAIIRHIELFTFCAQTQLSLHKTPKLAVGMGLPTWRIFLANRERVPGTMPKGPRGGKRPAEHVGAD